MDKEKILARINEIIAPDMTASEIIEVNHSPHPFTIGPQHIAHASDNHGGILGDATVQAIPCAHVRCSLSYDEHTFDRVCVMELGKNHTQGEAKDTLLSIEELITSNGIDGFVFAKTEFDFI